MASEFLSFGEAGAKFGAGPATVQRLVRQGYLIEHRDPRRGRQVKRADVDNLIRMHGNEVPILPLANPQLPPLAQRGRRNPTNPDFPPPANPLRRKVTDRGFSKP